VKEELSFFGQLLAELLVDDRLRDGFGFGPFWKDYEVVLIELSEGG
jgi:hypothetical protein